ncbi:MAG TPA: hypothetical protein VE422_05665 [Terriglobia bacterium]|nr:hypothetical protein [Terriglobia bacterium]
MHENDIEGWKETEQPRTMRLSKSSFTAKRSMLSLAACVSGGVYDDRQDRIAIR